MERGFRLISLFVIVRFPLALPRRTTLPLLLFAKVKVEKVICVERCTHLGCRGFVLEFRRKGSVFLLPSQRERRFFSHSAANLRDWHFRAPHKSPCQPPYGAGLARQNGGTGWGWGMPLISHRRHRPRSSKAGRWRSGRSPRGTPSWRCRLQPSSRWRVSRLSAGLPPRGSGLRPLSL